MAGCRVSPGAGGRLPVRYGVGGATTNFIPSQVLEWVEDELPGLARRGFRPLECAQQSGDVLVVPELWGHAVLNVRTSIAIATEVRRLVARFDRYERSIRA